MEACSPDSRNRSCWGRACPRASAPGRSRGSENLHAQCPADANAAPSPTPGTRWGRGLPSRPWERTGLQRGKVLLECPAWGAAAETVTGPPGSQGLRPPSPSPLTPSPRDGCCLFSLPRTFLFPVPSCLRLPPWFSASFCCLFTPHLSWDSRGGARFTEEAPRAPGGGWLPKTTRQRGRAEIRGQASLTSDSGLC